MWTDVYVIDGEGQPVFRQRVERPDSPEARHALHLDMCRHLSDSPMTPLPMARVVLKDYPADAAVADEPATTSAGRLML